MAKIPIHRDNHCGRRCPALFRMEDAIQTFWFERQYEDMKRVFHMLSNDQVTKVADRVYAITRISAVKGIGSVAYNMNLSYKYACELLNIEPKTWSTL